MRLLVTGREGQVAQALLGLADADLHVVALGRPDLDIRDRASIDRAIEMHRPDVVVNAAAYTAVDKAETDEAAAFAVNGEGAGHVAASAMVVGRPVIQISTDYVFSGDKTTPYVETDATGPQSVYGRSKLAGEEAVAAAHPSHVILRTAWVYGAYGNNFLKTMLRLAGDRDTVSVVSDQQGTPTYSTDIAEGIVAVARHIRAHPEAQDWRSVFHMVAGAETNWAAFAEDIFARSALAGGPSATVMRIPSSAYPTPAKRPANSRLDTTKFQRTFSHALPDWRDGVARCIAALAVERDERASTPA